MDGWLGTGTCAQEYISNLADMASAPYLARVWGTGGSRVLLVLLGLCRVLITHSTAFTAISRGTGAIAGTPTALYVSTFPLNNLCIVENKGLGVVWHWEEAVEAISSRVANVGSTGVT